MPNDTDNNGSASGTTPPNRPPLPTPSETEYLRREAEDAREAASHTLGEMRKSLRAAGDLRGWARTHPWTTLGAAAAAGFLAASAFVPRRRRREDEQHAALLERILTDEQIEARLRELAAENDRSEPPRESVLQTLATSLVRTLGPAVQSAVAAALTPQPVEDDAEESAAAPPDQPPAEPGEGDPADQTGPPQEPSS